MHMKSVDPTCAVLTQHTYRVRNLDRFHKPVTDRCGRHETSDISSIEGELVRVIQDSLDRWRPAY